MTKTMVLKPRISEKAYANSLNGNTYVFQVPSDANKITVAAAVADQFGVTVQTVNILNVKGKVKRTVRRGGRATLGKRIDVKKAYVTLKEGDAITIFANEEDSLEAKKSKTGGKK